MADKDLEDLADREAAELAEAAQAGLGDDAEAGQQVLGGMEFKTHVKFAGMGYRTNEVDFKLGQETEYLVRGRVTGIGDELMKNDLERHVVTITVASVTPPDE